jgi:hypothetical protein
MGTSAEAGTTLYDAAALDRLPDATAVLVDRTCASLPMRADVGFHVRPLRVSPTGERPRRGATNW